MNTAKQVYVNDCLNGVIWLTKADYVAYRVPQLNPRKSTTYKQSKPAYAALEFGMIWEQQNPAKSTTCSDYGQAIADAIVHAGEAAFIV